MESLQQENYQTLQMSIKYLAVPPKEVVERVKKNVKEEADESVKRLENLKNTDVLGELSNLHTQGVELVDPTDLTGSLKGLFPAGGLWLDSGAVQELNAFIAWSMPPVMMTSTDSFPRQSISSKAGCSSFVNGLST